MSRNLPTFGQPKKDEEKYEQQHPPTMMQQRQIELQQQLQHQQYDSNTMLFRPMPSWVVKREEDAIARIPKRPGEDIAKSFRLNNPNKSRQLKQKTHTFTTKALKYGRKGPPAALHFDNNNDYNSGDLTSLTNNSYNATIGRTDQQILNSNSVLPQTSPRSHTGPPKPVYEPTKISYTREGKEFIITCI